MWLSFWISCHQNLVNNAQWKKVVKNYLHKHPHERPVITVLRRVEWGRGSSTLKKCRWVGTTAPLEHIWKLKGVSGNGLHVELVLFSSVDSFCVERRREKKEGRGFWICFFCLFGISTIHLCWGPENELERQALYVVGYIFSTGMTSELQHLITYSPTLCKCMQASNHDQDKQCLQFLNSLVHNISARNFFACQYPRLEVCPEGNSFSAFIKDENECSWSLSKKNFYQGSMDAWGRGRPVQFEIEYMLNWWLWM